MPKKRFENVKLPLLQPDRCMDCPLLGAIPKSERRPGSQEALVCLGTWHAMTVRFSRVRKSGRDSKHPLTRPCDAKWERWQEAPIYGRYPVPYEAMNRYREEYIKEHKQFHIIFHDNRGRKKQQDNGEEERD